MGKWLDEFSQKTVDRDTDNTDESRVLSVLSVRHGGVLPKKYYPELSADGYVWCLDCKHLDGVCTHPQNPHRNLGESSQFPRDCRLFEWSKVKQ